MMARNLSKFMIFNQVWNGVCLRTYAKTVTSTKKDQIAIQQFQEQCTRRDQLIKKKGLFNPVIQKCDFMIYEDVENLIYLSKTNEDIKKAVKAIQRISGELNETAEKSGKDAITRLNNDLMLCLYSLQKPDLALEVFTNQPHLKHFDKRAMRVLLENLLRAKRYDSIVKVFNSYLAEYTADPTQAIPSSHLNIVTMALLKLNSNTSYAIMKQIVLWLNENKMNLSSSSHKNYLFLACQQSDFVTVLNQLYLTPGLRRADQIFCHSLKAVAFIELNRMEDAVNQIEMLVKISTPLKDANVVTYMLKHVKSKSSSNQKLQELVKEIEALKGSIEASQEKKKKLKIKTPKNTEDQQK